MLKLAVPILASLNEEETVKFYTEKSAIRSRIRSTRAASGRAVAALRPIALIWRRIDMPCDPRCRYSRGADLLKWRADLGAGRPS